MGVAGCWYLFCSRSVVLCLRSGHGPDNQHDGLSSRCGERSFRSHGALTLTLKLEATGAALTTQTNASGQYSFIVFPGRTRWRWVNPRTSVVSGVIVQVAKSTLIDIALTVGAVSEAVSVTASAQAQLQTIDSAVSSVIGREQVEELPTVTQRAVELAFLQPGAQPWTGGSYNGSSGTIPGHKATRIPLPSTVWIFPIPRLEENVAATSVRACRFPLKQSKMTR